MITNIRTALVARRDALQKDEKGFTLIELLVVVLIIGILAAIAIPVFLAQQDQARDSAVESDLGNAKVAYVSLLVDDPDGLADATPASPALDAFGFNESDGNTITVATGGADFCLEGTRADSTDIWSVTAAEGVTEAPCP